MSRTDFIGFDLGSSKIAGISATVANGSNYKINGNVLTHSEGFRAGMITDTSLAEQSILDAVYALEKRCGKNIKHADITLSAFGTKSHYIYKKHKISGDSSTITKADMTKLMQKIIDDFKVEDQEIIHHFPIEFTVDDHQAITDPVGMIGKELGCRLHIVTVNASVLHNLINCLAKCQVEVGSIASGVYTAGLKLLTEDEKKLGALVIDCGARTTSLGIFLDNNLIYANCLPIGGFHISSDIAKVFSLDFNTAEKIKVLHATAIFDAQDHHPNIDLEEIEPAGDYGYKTLLSPTDLAAVALPRIEEIFTAIKQEYDRIGFDPLLARRIILTGGGAHLNRVGELVQSIFGKQTRIAHLEPIPGLEETYNTNFYVNCCGLLELVAAKLGHVKTFAEVGAPKKLLGKIVGWLKNNF